MTAEGVDSGCGGGSSTVSPEIAAEGVEEAVMGASVASAANDCCGSVGCWATIPGCKAVCATADVAAHDCCRAGADSAVGMPIDGSGVAEATLAGAALTGAAAGDSMALRAGASVFAAGASIVFPALAALALSLA